MLNGCLNTVSRREFVTLVRNFHNGRAALSKDLCCRPGCVQHSAPCPGWAGVSVRRCLAAQPFTRHSPVSPVSSQQQTPHCKLFASPDPEWRPGTRCWPGNYVDAGCRDVERCGETRAGAHHRVSESQSRRFNLVRAG